MKPKNPDNPRNKDYVTWLNLNKKNGKSRKIKVDFPTFLVLLKRQRKLKKIINKMNDKTGNR